MLLFDDALKQDEQTEAISHFSSNYLPSVTPSNAVDNVLLSLGTEIDAPVTSNVQDFTEKSVFSSFSIILSMFMSRMKQPTTFLLMMMKLMDILYQNKKLKQELYIIFLT